MKVVKNIIFYFLSILFTVPVYGQRPDSIDIKVGTYLGNEKRNYYGNTAPDKLDTIWRLYLGKGLSPAYGNPNKMWYGAGWTGQPLVVTEGDKVFLIQGAFDYNLKKIDAQTGKIVWEYRFEDILKGTGTIWENKNARFTSERYIIMQGSRRGWNQPLDAEEITSFRAISYTTGREIWRINIKQTDSYSRDVDGSAIVVNDTAYLAFENGIFTVFNPDPAKAKLRDYLFQPIIYDEVMYYKKEDMKIHGDNLECESSPCVLGERVYTTAGSGRVYGYNMKTDSLDWIFDIGADLNGSPVVTHDSCLLIPVEKDYIEGRGGVYKLDPSKSPEESVVWWYPTKNRKWFHWKGGIVGSVAVNDAYNNGKYPYMAAFMAVDGNLYVVNHKKTVKGKTESGPNNKHEYPVPELLFKTNIGPTISTPLIVENRIIAALDDGLYLYEFNMEDDELKFKTLDVVKNFQVDATPIVWNNRIYVASLDGYLYCFGRREEQ